MLKSLSVQKTLDFPRKVFMTRMKLTVTFPIFLVTILYKLLFEVARWINLDESCFIARALIRKHVYIFVSLESLEYTDTDLNNLIFMIHDICLISTERVTNYN